MSGRGTANAAVNGAAPARRWRGARALTRTARVWFDAIMKTGILRCASLVALFASLAGGLSGCGLAAAPCRVTSAGLKIIPLVGPVAAAPSDACANAIDPTPTRS